MPQKLGLEDEDRQRIANYYSDGHSLKQTASEFKCSMRTVRYSLEKLNVPTRTIGEGYAALWKDPEYRENQVHKRLGKPSGATGKKWKRPEGAKSNARYGSANNLWKGGITKLQVIIRTSAEYSRWRSRILERDKYTCVLCGNNYNKDKKVILDVDHIHAFCLIIKEYEIKSMEQAIFCEKLWDINNGRTLCRDCHRKTENYGGKNRSTERGPKRKTKSIKG